MVLAKLPKIPKSDMKTQKPQLQGRTDGAPPQLGNFSNLCYRSGAEGHLARNCTTAPTIPHAHIPDAINANAMTAGKDAGKDSLATYAMEGLGGRKSSIKTVTPIERQLVESCVDEHSMIKDDDDDVTTFAFISLVITGI